MLAQTVAQFFQFKVVTSIFVLTSDWALNDQVVFSRQLSLHGISATFTDDPRLKKILLAQKDPFKFQGVLYVRQANDTLLEQVNPEYFSLWYKWLVIAEELPQCLANARYDIDITWLKWELDRNGGEYSWGNTFTKSKNDYALFEDIYVHPRDGISVHPWAYWSKDEGIQLTNDYERVLRRLDLKKYPVKIAIATGVYSSEWYSGTFRDYMIDESIPELDSNARTGYKAGSMILEFVNASEVLDETAYFLPMSNDNGTSMIGEVMSGASDITGNLRMLFSRLQAFDYIMPIWPFRMGFLYLAERKSSSSMFIAPFTPDVWWFCLGLGIILAIAQRIMARKPKEKHGAFMAVLATLLQQDADAVPEGLSGRWAFMVLSISSMIIYAYYTSAIVSALMSSGTAGPTTLRALADSKYDISCGDYYHMRQLFFEVQTNNTDLEYLKKKKKGPKFYTNNLNGIELLKKGTTAYHTEYNQIYPLLKSFTFDQICKLSYVDTIPLIKTWIVATKNSQFTSIFRAKGVRLMEIGIDKRILSKIQIRPPECRSSLLAEQVKFGDVASLLILTFLGVVIACGILGAEIAIDRAKNKKSKDTAQVSDFEDGYSIY